MSSNKLMKITAADFEKVVSSAVNERMKIAMADPLPPPDKDTRQKPNPKAKPSSPYEPWRKYPTKTASLENPDMDIMLPFPVDTLTPEDVYSEPLEGAPDGQNIAQGYRYSGDPNSELINPRRPGREQGPATLQEHNMKLKIQQMLRPNLPLASVPSSRTIRDHLKKGTKGLRDYDDAGGGRSIPQEDWLKLIRSVPKA